MSQLSVEACIRGRRSIRSFTGQAVSRELIRELLEDAAMAPSGSNAQPWAFIAVDDPALIEKIKMFSPGLNGLPACLVFFCIDQEAVDGLKAGGQRETGVEPDLAMAAQNFMLAAYAKGLGTCPVKSFQAPIVRKILQIPPQLTPDLLVTVGYPAQMPEAPRRKPLDQLLTWNVGSEDHEG